MSVTSGATAPAAPNLLMLNTCNVHDLKEEFIFFTRKKETLLNENAKN